MHINYSSKIILSTILSSNLLLSACTGESDNQKTTYFDTEQITLNSSKKTAYLNIISGKEVNEDEEWHISVNRLNISLNENVETALGDNQDEFYQDDTTPDINVFLNAIPEDELNNLYQFTSSENLIFNKDELQYAIKDWYNFNSETNTYSVKPESNWILRSSSDKASYAKFTVSNIIQSGNNFTATFNFDVQAQGESHFTGTTSTSVNLSSASGKVCFDFDSGSIISCDNEDWDIAMEGNNLILNGGDSGSGYAAVLGPINNNDFSSYNNGTTSDGISFTQAYSSDIIGGTFLDYPWYAYNLQDDHGIFPNYRIYVIDTDTTTDNDELFKIQLTNFYNEKGGSGYVSLRVMPLFYEGE